MPYLPTTTDLKLELLELLELMLERLFDNTGIRLGGRLTLLGRRDNVGDLGVGSSFTNP